MPTTIEPTKQNHASVAGSLNSSRPSTQAPTAPMPVQTAWAVPIGMVFWAISKSAPLAVMQVMEKMIQPQRSPDSASPSSSPTGLLHANMPAIIMPMMDWESNATIRPSKTESPLKVAASEPGICG